MAALRKRGTTLAEPLF
ncbi:hypothetical protein J9880_11565 [Rahnella victoriana]|nr:hypothetical protein J9880_11565 [Rahnella victoriana]